MNLTKESFFLVLVKTSSNVNLDIVYPLNIFVMVTLIVLTEAMKKIVVRKYVLLTNSNVQMEFAFYQGLFF